MPYEPQHLPFSKLTGISEKTIAIHHDKLYAGYVAKRNEIIEKLTSSDRSSANQSYSEFRALKHEESFATNGQYLHEFYFNVLGGSGGEATDELRTAIEKDFGSYSAWMEDFKACGMSARGWVVLGFDHNDGKLHNYICDAHNQGGIWGTMPIVVLDTYEHAYFIDYGSDRKAYIEEYFANLDWTSANKIFTSIKK